MNFKDCVAADRDIFINNEEFGGLMIIDGVILKAVMDERTSARSGIMSRNFEGLYGDFIDVYFKSSEYCRKRERIPKHGEYIKVWDKKRGINKRYEVVNAVDEMGVAHLAIAAYRQNDLRASVASIIRGGLNDKN